MNKTLRASAGLALLIVLLVAAGCGSSGGSGSGTDTAKLAPPTSFLYAEATIDPSGGQEAAMRSILGDLPGEGAPEDRINNLLEQASKDDNTPPHVDYNADIKPWLGDKASVFVAPSASGSAGSPMWAVVIATSDEGKANDAIKKGKESTDREASYNGVDYTVDK